MEEEKDQEVTECTTRDRLKDMHENLVGRTINLTDTDMIILILEHLIEKVEEFERHSHTIS